MAQRLVRKLCPDCGQPGEHADAELAGLGLDRGRLAGTRIQVARGCDQCRWRGYRGRMGLFEVFRLGDEVRSMINDQQVSTWRLRQRARELGMRTLREDGVRKVLAGATTAGEVRTATMGDTA